MAASRWQDCLSLLVHFGFTSAIVGARFISKAALRFRPGARSPGHTPCLNAPPSFPRAEKEADMPERETKERARRDRRQGKSPSTQAGEFVREEFHHVREGKHGARSAKQAIAIGLSKARRAGVDLPASGQSSETRRTQQDRESARHPHAPSRARSRATSRALEHEGRAAGSHRAISRQSHAAARQRSSSERSAAARKAARTKGAAGRSAAARKAARTRQEDRG